MFVIANGELVGNGKIKINDIEIEVTRDEKYIWNKCTEKETLEKIQMTMSNTKGIFNGLYDRNKFYEIVESLVSKKLIFMADNKTEMYSYIKTIGIKKTAVPGLGIYNRRVYLPNGSIVQLTKDEYLYYRDLDVDNLTENDYEKIFQISKEKIIVFTW